MTGEPGSMSEDKHGGYETRDVAFRPIVAAGTALVVMTIIAVVLVRWVFGYYVSREAKLSPAANPLASTYGRQLPPEPRLQTAPIQDLRQLRASEDAILGTY